MITNMVVVVNGVSVVVVTRVRVVIMFVATAVMSSRLLV